MTKDQALCTLIDLAILGSRRHNADEPLQAVERVMKLCEDAELIDKLEEV